MFLGENFEKIRKQLQRFSEEREQVIRHSRDILRFSKMAISSLHRNDIKEAQEHLKEAKKGITLVAAMAKKDSRLAGVGAYSAGLQEYVEAAAFFHFVKTGKLLECDTLAVDPEEYLMGLSDLTGELARRAVLKTISKHYPDVHVIRDFVVGIHDFFLTLDLGNGELRKKYDAIKWNLKKIEDIIYDIETKNKVRADDSTV